MPATADEPRRPRPVRTAPVWADPPPEAVLRRMIGAAPAGSLDELRTAYDLAVHRATRSGDHQHALALSRAYDRLPATTRARLYPSSRALAGEAVSPTRRPGRMRAASEEPPRRHRPHRRGSWLRVFVYGTLGTAVLALAAAGSIVHSRQGREPTPLVVRPELPTAPTVRGPGGAVVVPTSAPTGANGLATLLCQPVAGSTGYSTTAPRGAVAACVNGATPMVVG